MSIEQLKKILESEREKDANSGHYVEGESCSYYMNEIEAYKDGHEAATNRLLPLLQKAVEILSEINIDNPSFEDSRIEWMEIQIDKSLAEEIREFLAEIKKESGK